MFCAHCGHQYNNTSRFCSHCGKPLAVPPPGHPSSSTPPSQHSRMNYIIVGTFIFAVLLSAAGGWFFFLGGEEKVMGNGQKEVDTVSCANAEIFIKDTASAEEIDELGRRINDMPEVKNFAFISKDEALEILRTRLAMDGKEDMLEKLQGNPLPASYKIQLHDREDTREVASRFYDDPVVDNSVGETDGVQFSESPSMCE